MTLKIVIEMDNAAFGETPDSRNAELQRILWHVTADIEHYTGGQWSKIYDINGNVVGKATVTK